jgi:transposase InsO family protein
MKVHPGLIQFTALDDCSRYRVLGLYGTRTATNAVHFLEERLLEEAPFAIQRIQTDRGGEFFGMAFQRALRAHRIKFRPTRPRSPHLNGKVERSQQTDRIEFWPTIDMNDPQLSLRLEEWQFFYNWHRPHSALDGRTPIDRVCDLLAVTPTSSQAFWLYNPMRERYRESDYKTDRQLARALKRSV